MRSSLAFASIAFGTALFALTAEKPDAPPLHEGLGKHGRKVTTASAEAQRYFDQGLIFLYAFNHDEAIGSFRHAAKLDPGCAMAHWGVAVANGPHINNPAVPPDRAKAAWEALLEARKHAAGASDVEKALIEALGARYAEKQPDDRAPLDKAYAQAMKKVWGKFPKDADVGALYAESLMDLRPWDLWTIDGKPQPETPEIVATLEAVLALAPNHPLALHLYIHAVEASPTPGKADAASDRLRRAHPGLGHLVHMPSHIDIRRGRWQEATEANDRAIAADRAYAKRSPRQGFYRLYMAHNHHMLSFAAMMQGQSDRALKAAREMIAAVPAEWVKVKENAAIADGFLAAPLEVLMRFGRWDELLKEPAPAGDFPISTALRLSARGVALAAQGKTAEARAEQKAFREAVKKVPKEATFSNNKASDLLAVGDDLLEGELLLREGKVKEGLVALYAAVKKEDGLRYAEPPDWVIPVRHALGAALLKTGQPAEAERAYLEDLRRWPGNGWSLYGLAVSLEMQGKKSEAAEVRKAFEAAWKRADVKLTASCFCQAEGR
jgi:tetratricopeptide (TPR) repeat protein